LIKIVYPNIFFFFFFSCNLGATAVGSTAVVRRRGGVRFEEDKDVLIMINIANGEKQNQVSRSTKITCGDDDRTQQEDQEDNQVYLFCLVSPGRKDSEETQAESRI
jgi:hypothetical protein